jgi:hypothetical protein
VGLFYRRDLGALTLRGSKCPFGAVLKSGWKAAQPAEIKHRQSLKLIPGDFTFNENVLWGIALEMVFLEELPPQCPPAGAKAMEIEGAYRVVSCDSPTIQDFWSQDRLGVPIRPTADPCKWRSCSLFLSRDKAVDIAGKLPKARIKEPHLALVNIQTSDGRALVNARTSHVDLWLSTTFDPQAAVVNLEKV